MVRVPRYGFLAATRYAEVRSVLEPRLGPRVLRDVERIIRARAAELVADVVGRDAFDVVTDLPEVFPVQVPAS